MKTSDIRNLTAMFVVAVMAMLPATAMAQQKVADKELTGTWVMESMQWDGEDKIICGEDYAQFKYYGANGEYACAEIVQSNGSVQVLPHEYGTYTFKNGKYTEMGRDGIVVLKDKTTFVGRWQTRNDVWKKKALPKEVVDYIVSVCKATQPAPKSVQSAMLQHLFPRAKASATGKKTVKK